LDQKVSSSSRRRASLAILVFIPLLSSIATGCSSTDSSIVGHYPGELALQDWRTIANTNRPGRGEILRIVDAGRSDAFSNHIVIVQSGELPHFHEHHDATVSILRGNGTIVIGREKKKVRAGSVLFIPRKVVHHFSNEASEPTVALVVFAPPFDGKDRHIVRQDPGEGGSAGQKRSFGDSPLDRAADPVTREAADGKTTSEALPGRPLSSPGAVFGE
jgi:mannose-6-phosphate isomerase-like protein (cupin superfamily)